MSTASQELELFGRNFIVPSLRGGFPWNPFFGNNHILTIRCSVTSLTSCWCHNCNPFLRDSNEFWSSFFTSDRAWWEDLFSTQETRTKYIVISNSFQLHSTYFGLGWVQIFFNLLVPMMSHSFCKRRTFSFWMLSRRSFSVWIFLRLLITWGWTRGLVTSIAGRALWTCGSHSSFFFIWKVHSFEIILPLIYDFQIFEFPKEVAKVVPFVKSFSKYKCFDYKESLFVSMCCFWINQQDIVVRGVQGYIYIALTTTQILNNYCSSFLNDLIDMINHQGCQVKIV